MVLKAIVFDLGKVLIDFSLDRACAQLSLLTKSSIQDVHDFLFKSGVENEFEHGKITVAELHALFEKKFNCDINLEDLKKACADIFTPINPSITLVHDLKEHFPGRLILLSNTNIIHWDYIRAHWPFVELFDAHVLSFEVQMMKPMPAIYHHAIQLAGCEAEECFFTDDLWENVRGAREVGMHATQFSSAQILREQLEQYGVRV